MVSPDAGNRIGIPEYFDPLRTRRMGYESANSIGLVDSVTPY